MVLMVFAVLGGFLLSYALEFRIRNLPHVGRPLLTSLALLGTGLLLTGFITLEWEDPLWLQGATIVGTIVAFAVGNYLGKQRPRGATGEVLPGPSAQAPSLDMTRRGRGIIRLMGAFILAYTVGTIGFVVGIQIWNGRPGPYGVVAITSLAITGSSLGAAFAVRQAIRNERG